MTQRLIDLLTKAIEAFLAVCLAIMLLMVFGNVVLRYGFNSGITVSEEASRFLFIWLTFLGAVVAMKEHAHLGVDSLVRVLPPAARKACTVVSILLMLGANWLFMSGSWAQIEVTRETKAAVTGVSMAIIYWPGVIASILISALLLVQLARILRREGGIDELVLVTESEELALAQQAVDSLHLPATAADRKPS